MASTVLPNGIIVPEKFSRDWYADLYHNWQELDNLLGGGTPKDGTLTIQKNGDTVGTFSANQETDETVNITVPDVNNGTLTIQQNGTTVDTFSANQATDETINITVPTATSELTNDSGFITEDDTKIPLAGSNQISGNLIPATTNAYDLGGSSYQWNNAYIKSLTINGVACGDILTYNASEFVNVTGAQTISGVKTFSSNVIIQGSKKVTCNLDNSFIELDGGTTWGKGGSIVLSGQDRSSYTNSVLIVSKSDTSTDILQYQNGELKPLSNNTNNSSLGTPTNKWAKVYSDDIVHTTGNETIGGVKTFSNGDKTFADSAPLRIQGCNNGNEFSNNARTVLEFRSNRDTVNKSCIYLTKFRQNRAQGSMGGNDNVILTMDVLENEVRTNDLLRFTAHNWINDAPTEVYLEPATKASNIQSFLGSSTRPWGNTATNTINDINPGALSLPSSTYINVDTTNWDLTCQNELLGSFTPTADGWLMLHIANSGSNEVAFWIIGGVIRINNKSSINTTDNNNFNMFTIPVEKDVTYNIYGNASEYVAGRSIRYCRFMPCRGNV